MKHILIFHHQIQVISQTIFYIYSTPRHTFLCGFVFLINISFIKINHCTNSSAPYLFLSFEFNKKPHSINIADYIAMFPGLCISSALFSMCGHRLCDFPLQYIQSVLYYLTPIYQTANCHQNSKSYRNFTGVTDAFLTVFYRCNYWKLTYNDNTASFS